MLTDLELSAGLAQFEEEWAHTGAPTTHPYAEIPDGIYEALIEDAWLAESAASGNAAVVWRLRIPGAQPGGRVVTRGRSIAAHSLGRLRRDLEKCGLSLARITELPNRIGEIVGNRVGIAKRTRKGRACFYLRWPATQSSPLSVRLLRAMMLDTGPPQRTSKNALQLLKRSMTWSSESRTA
jgi:hypothetical protein